MHMRKIILILSFILMLGLSACGSSPSAEKKPTVTDTQTKEVSDDVNNIVEATENPTPEADNEVSSKITSTFQIKRENEDTIIDNCIQSVDIISDNTIRIILQEEKVTSFVEILNIFSEQTIKVYVNDSLIATLNVDDNVKKGILEISNISETDLKPLVAQLQSSIQSEKSNSDYISLEDRLYNVAFEAIGSDEWIENIACDATDVKYLIIASTEDDALLMEFAILYKMKDDFDNMKVMFTFYSEKGNASSVIRRSTYSADTRSSMDLDSMKDYHELLQYAE